jgi:hypothetical protein
MSTKTISVPLRIDWKRLHDQKQWLYDVAYDHPDPVHANGILALIERIQDAAVQAGVHESDVYGRLT